MKLPPLPVVPVSLLAVFLCLATAASAQTTAPNLADAVQQLKQGDTFRGMLTLNEVIARQDGPSGDRRVAARAHALRAMVYLGQNQPERAQAAVALALKAEPAFVPSADEVNAATVALFGANRSRSATPEADGDAAERAGNYQQAFLSYLAAYQALPTPPPAADDRRLRERIITVVKKLPTAPVVPAEAQAHARKAAELLEAEAVLGGTAGASSNSAASELAQAVRIAPWWPEATFQLATVQQRLQRVDEALANLTLYRLADPDGYAARSSAANKPPATTAPAPPAAPVAKAPPAVPAGSGTVYVYRRSNFVGGSARAKIDCNGQRIAELQNGRVVTFKVPAGGHTLRIDKDDQALTVAPGGEYYFKGSVGAFGFNVKAVGAAEAKAEIKEHSLKANDAKRTTTMQCLAPGAVVPVPKADLH